MPAPGPPGPNPQAWDLGNPLLDMTPGQMWATPLPCPDGVTRLAVTVRTPSTTLTLLLDRAEAARWGTLLTGAADRLPVLVTAPGPVPPGPLNGGRP